MSKKERTIVRVDEDKIKRMIAGEEPYLQENSRDKDKPEEIQSVPPTAVSAAPENKDSRKDKASANPARKQSERISYADVFLKTVRTSDKKQTTVQLSESLFRKMEILTKATSGLSVGLFINNVLMHHFEEYEEDINLVKEKYIAKLSEDV